MNVLSPTHPVGYAVMVLRGRMDHARENPDLGASAIEWVIITAVVVGMAIAVAAVIWTKINSANDSISNSNVPTTGGGSGP